MIGDDGTNYGVLEISEALSLAKEKGLDLIEISPTAKPPIAKIMDYGKWQYQEERKHRGTGKKAVIWLFNFARSARYFDYILWRIFFG